jgi:hypothetical protein
MSSMQVGYTPLPSGPIISDAAMARFEEDGAILVRTDSVTECCLVEHCSVSLWNSLPFRWLAKVVDQPSTGSSRGSIAPVLLYIIWLLTRDSCCVSR